MNETTDLQNNVSFKQINWTSSDLNESDIQNKFLVAHTHGGAEVLTPAMQALKAEIIETLHKTEYNHSFSSAEKDGERYCLMFPGHSATEKYSCTFTTKSAYLLQYGISEILKSEQIQDIKDVPYTFKFDETTTSQVLKQYDGYLCYWSPIYEEIVRTYAGSLFMDHCSAANLVHHFYEIKTRITPKCKCMFKRLFRVNTFISTLNTDDISCF